MSVKEKAIETVEVATGIRLLAKSAGYVVEQKVTVRDYGSDHQMPQMEDPNRPWFVRGIAGRTPFTYGNDFWFGPFSTEDEATTEGLPEIVSCDARAAKLGEDYAVRVVTSEGDNHWLIYRRGECVSKPFGSPTAALDEAEKRAAKSRENREQMFLRHQLQRIERCQLPASQRGACLATFKADTATLAHALQVAQEYVKAFAPSSDLSLWFCGESRSGKTSLACAVASAVAAAGHFARYASIVDVLHAQVSAGPALNELFTCDLLVLDWFGIQATGDDRASLDQSELLGTLSGYAAGAVLDTRALDRRPTLLVADCDQMKLRRCLGNERYDRSLHRHVIDFGGFTCHSA
ncbi:MAG: hypothetical protein WAQ52_07815 [Terriglobales bacterium]